MRRRSLVATSLALGALPSWSRAQSGQAGRPRRLAIVNPVMAVDRLTETGFVSYRAFFDELRRLGLVEGASLVVERYSAEGRADRLAAIARDIARSAPDVIFTTTTPVARAVHAATRTIPIVAITADPVAMGLVASLARPGGNVTGVSIDAGLEILGKRIQFLRQLVPGLRHLAYLGRATSWNQPDGQFVAAFCGGLGIVASQAPLADPVDDASYRAAFDRLVADGADAVLVAAQAENRVNAETIIAHVARVRLPAVYESRDYPEAGGLVSYGIDFQEVYRMIARSVRRVLAGSPPADIPFLQPTKFELVVNLKAARQLGMTIAPSFLVGADEVID